MIRARAPEFAVVGRHVRVEHALDGRGEAQGPFAAVQRAARYLATRGMTSTPPRRAPGRSDEEQIRPVVACPSKVTGATTTTRRNAPRWRDEAEHQAGPDRGRPRRGALERGRHLRPCDLGARHCGVPQRLWRRFPPPYWAAAIVTAILFFVSLLAHEASHAVVARRHGVGVRSITLWLFGGVAQLEGEAHTPGADFAIAAVGPGTSMALAGGFAATQILFERAGAHGLAVGVCSWLWQINLLLAGFNLIPAAPLDGGRILRAGLWRGTGNRQRASVLAARAGMGFGGVLIALGVVEFAVGSPFGLWPVFLGWFLLMAARAEEGAARQLGGIRGRPVSAVMNPHPPVVASAMTVSELLVGPRERGGTAQSAPPSWGRRAGSKAW